MNDCGPDPGIIDLKSSNGKNLCSKLNIGITCDERRFSHFVKMGKIQVLWRMPLKNPGKTHKTKGL
jgi:hypothetical protein